MEQVYKTLARGGLPCHGGKGKWSLPTEAGPGTWRHVSPGPLVPCRNGLHLCRLRDLLDWLAPCLYEAEYRGEVIEHIDKLVVREARLLRPLPWEDKNARLFACDCAERVLAHYEAVYPGEERPRQAIAKSRQFALGLATADQLAAARDAAWAARAAVKKGAEAARSGLLKAAWEAPGTAWEAAWIAEAASEAAFQAAAAARASAWQEAEPAWSSRSAVRAATAAAWSRAAAAGPTAGAARAAATASSAERAWQTSRLLEILKTGTEESDA